MSYTMGTYDERARAVALYRSGMSMEEAGMKMGRTRSFVRRALEAMKVKPRSWSEAYKRPPVKTPVYANIQTFTPRHGFVGHGIRPTRFVRARKTIPPEVRAEMVMTIRAARDKLNEMPISIDTKRDRDWSLAHLERLFEYCDTTFASFDVEAADPIIEAADAVPKWFSRSTECFSSVGSTAAMVAELGGRA